MQLVLLDLRLFPVALETLGPMSARAQEFRRKSEGV